jgi:hypothetical protein
MPEMTEPNQRLLELARKALAASDVGDFTLALLYVAAMLDYADSFGASAPSLEERNHRRRVFSLIESFVSAEKAMRKELPGERLSSRFWQTLKPGEFEQIVFEQDGCLNAEQCARLWRLEERNSEPPLTARVLINRKDLDRLIRNEMKRRKS